MHTPDPATCVDLARYPVDRPGSAEYGALLTRVRAGLEADESYAGVEAVLDGRSSRVKSLTLEPGDLQIFKGLYALHRVSPVTGARAR
jgi:predicted 2-oxoglutarate/Fe(II)-dependent dioxygenase YbiX